MKQLRDLAEEMVEAAPIPRASIADLRARARRRRARSALTVSAALGLVVVVVGTFVLRTDCDDAARVTVRGTTMQPLRTIPDLPAGIPQGSPAKRARVAGPTGRTVVRGNTVWAVKSESVKAGPPSTKARLVAFDATTLRPRGSARLPDDYAPVAIAAGANSVWVLNQRFDGSPFVVTQVDPSSLRVRREIELPGAGPFGATEPSTIAVTPGAAWIGYGQLFRVDAATGAVSAFPLPSQAEGIVADRTSLWMFFAASDVPVIRRFDLTTNAFVRDVTVDGLGFPWSLAADDDAAWLTYNTLVAPGQVELRLTRVDSLTYDQRTFAIPAIQVVTGDGQVWVQLYDDTRGVLNRNGLVGQIDPETGTILRTVRTPVSDPPVNGPTFTIARGSIWVGPVRLTL